MGYDFSHSSAFHSEKIILMEASHPEMRT